MKKFQETGSTVDLKSSGRRRCARTEQNIEVVRDSVAVSPAKSIRRRSQQFAGILIRRDIGNRALRDFNYQLDLMCNNFGVEFVEVNNCVGRRDLARDGTHLNRGGASRLGSLMLDVVSQYLAQLVPTSLPQKATSVAPTPETGGSSGTGAVGGCPDDLGRPGVVDTSRLSGNLH
ncbi:hypothetical protein J6590_080023, partial [Homalodisca vitripennis]